VIVDFWSKGDVKGALRHLLQMREPTASAVASDVFRTVQLRSEAFNLESCALLLPFLCRTLSATKFEDYIIVMARAVHTLLETFGPVIKDTIRASVTEARRGGLDPSMEERLSRCEVCHQSLEELRRPLANLAAGYGRPGGGECELDRIVQRLQRDLEAHCAQV
jgi:hypothetical protein